MTYEWPNDVVTAIACTLSGAVSQPPKKWLARTRSALVPAAQHIVAQLDANEARIQALEEMVDRALLVMPERYEQWHEDARALLGKDPS